LATLPPIIAIGLAYGLMAGTTWNVIIYIVNGQKVGTAIGVTNSLLNLGLVLTPIVMGEIKDHSDYLEFGYYWVTRFSLILSFISIGLSFFVW
jgi:threonine/homoserine efflux transporter RhtA